MDRFKITEADINNNNVKSVVGSRLTGTVQENKNVFDRLVEFIAGKFNGLVDFLSGTGAAAEIGAAPQRPDGPETVQGQLNEAASTQNAHASRTDNPHSVTSEQVGLGNVLNVQQASKVEFEAHRTDTANPHSVTKSQVGLGNADNTSDVNKPISTATQTALNAKVDKVTGKALSTNDYDNTEKASVASNTTARHTHSNKALLDSYTQIEANLADAVVKKHAHSNKSLLDTYAQTEVNLEDAVTKKHAHANKTVLDGITEVTQVLGSATNKVPSEKAVSDAMVDAGADDMVKAIYDPTGKNTNAFDSENHDYDNSTSGLTATNVQDAIDESAEQISTMSTRVDTLEASLLTVYGVKIDTLNSNPSTALTYIDNAVGFTPASGNNGAFSYGSWEDKFPFNQIRPCLYKDGAVNYYLNPNDYTKKLDGSTSDITTGADGDVMVEFPKVYWKFESVGTDLFIRYSPYKVDGGYKCLAHTRGSTEKDKCYISAYLGNDLASKLRSLSGKMPTASKTIGAFRTLAQANGAGYDQMAYYQMLMLQVLFVVMFKNRDSQTALGRGYVDGNSESIATGGTNAKGMFYGEATGKQQIKFCGIEDFGVIYFASSMVFILTQAEIC